MWYFHVQDGQWIEGPTLRIARRFAGCGTFVDGQDTYILAVGGIAGAALKSSEMLKIGGNSWFDGPNMSFRSEETIVSSLANSLEGEVAWVFGGTNTDAGADSDFIFRLHCQGKPEDGQCQWIEHGMRLKIRRDWATAITF